MVYQRIWDLAEKYQDKRDDIGHAKTVLEYAIRLLTIVPADEKIVIPAAILHDTGWSQVKKDDWMKIFQDNVASRDKIVIRVKHEKEGAKLARVILKSVGYDQNPIERIVEIIDGHDTRGSYLSNEEGVVRDADRLSMFSRWGVEYDLRIRNLTPEYYLKYLEDKLINRYKFFFEQSRQIAFKELSARKFEYQI